MKYLKKEVKRGRPKGNKNPEVETPKFNRNSKYRFKNGLTRTAAKGSGHKFTEKKKFDPEKDKLTLKWVNKERDYKTWLEEEKKFREAYLNGELKVRESMYIDKNQKFLAYNETGDLVYKPF